MRLPRFILAADHRTPFDAYARDHGLARPRIGRFKRLVVAAMAAARDKDARARAQGGLLLDRSLGGEALDEARKAGIPSGEPLEEAGKHPLTWVEGGVEALIRRKPAFVKVQVPVFESGSNGDPEREATMLLAAQSRLKAARLPLVVELHADGPTAFAAQHRALTYLSERGVAPKVWELAGHEDSRELDRLARRVRKGSGIMLVGRGEPESTLARWFTAARVSPAYLGFCVGRTIFWGPFEAWAAGRTGDDVAVAQIAERYLHVLGLWR